MNFLFYADIPRTKLGEGIIIYQWAALTPKNVSSPVPPIGLVCKVQVGNADGTEVIGYKTGALAAADAAGVTYDQVNTANKDPDRSLDYIRDYPEFYELIPSDNDYKNQVQMCLL